MCIRFFIYVIVVSEFQNWISYIGSFLVLFIFVDKANKDRTFDASIFHIPNELCARAREVTESLMRVGFHRNTTVTLAGN